MFTVVIPIYNHSLFLAEAINSALQDDLTSEVILVDDGSSDDSAVIAERFAAQYPQLVRTLPNHTKENRGAHFRLNQLISAARSQYIAVLNSDDYFVAGKLSAMKSTFDATECDVVIGALVIVNENGEHIGVKLPHLHFEYTPPPSLINGHLYQSDLLKQAVISQNIAGTTSNYVFRKTFWESAGKFKEYRYAHDWEFLLQAVSFGRVQYNPSALTAYRMHSSNTISENRSKIVDELWRITRQFASDISISEPEALSLFRYNRNLTPDVIAFHDNGTITYTRARQFGSYSEERYDFLCSEDVIERNIYFQNNAILNIMLFDTDYLIINFGVSSESSVGAKRNVPYIYLRKGIRIAQAASEERASTMFGVSLQLSTASPIKYIESRALEHLIQRAQICKSSHLANRRQTNGAMKTGLVKLDDRNPFVLALPGYLAVGGVERVLESVMQELAEYYQFVVVNMERLPEGAGSSTDRILRYAECIYELSHVNEAKIIEEALSLIRDRYNPQCIWICNGCHAHMRNMHLIRQVFKGAVIIDQQCYDAREGWISHYRQPNLHNADWYVACNQKIKTALKERFNIDQGRVKLIHPPFSADFLKDEAALEIEANALLSRCGISAQQTVLGVVARVSDQKQPLLYVEVMHRLQQAQAPFHLIFIGDGPAMEQTREEIRRLKLRNMTMIGFMDRPHSAYYAMDCYLILSRYEGLPVSMLEALATGVPVLSTDVGDISDVLSEFDGGEILTEVNPESIAAHVTAFLSGINIRKSIIKKNREKILNRFSASRTAISYRSIFDSISTSNMISYDKIHQKDI